MERNSERRGKHTRRKFTLLGNRLPRMFPWRGHTRQHSTDKTFCRRNWFSRSIYRFVNVVCCCFRIELNLSIFEIIVDDIAIFKLTSGNIYIISMKWVREKDTKNFKIEINFVMKLFRIRCVYYHFLVRLAKKSYEKISARKLLLRDSNLWNFFKTFGLKKQQHIILCLIFVNFSKNYNNKFWSKRPVGIAFSTNIKYWKK